MANIGTFTKTEQGFVGEIVTLSFQANNVRLVPEDERHQRERPKPPRLMSAEPRSAPPGPSAPARAATTSRSSWTIRASTLPIYANLFDEEAVRAITLIWSRGRKGHAD